VSEPLLLVQDLHVHFRQRGGGNAVIRAVDGVSLHVAEGETLALVGESGCGKSTTAYGILGLERPVSGRISFAGRPMALGQQHNQHGAMQIVLQDPSAALNPKMRIGNSIGEPLAIAGMARAQRQARVAELLDLVGLSVSQARSYPNELSGGQRQRVVIARALALAPRLLICDEPVSALDVSIRSQILNLLLRLQQELGLAYLFISHDLSVVRHFANRVAVMYLGTIVEQGVTEAVFARPVHPYTEALLSAIPLPDPRTQRARRKIVLSGDPPSPMATPSGCTFASRCPLREARCTLSRPALTPAGPAGEAACFVRN
jgi:peptide/nickel transport system ATP-binding protein/oligopeptide transport system ATP-binding protein